MPFFRRGGQESTVDGAAAPQVEGKYQRRPERALNADLRVQARVGRDEPALAAGEQAVGTDRAVDRPTEAVRIAAVIEGHRLGRRDAAFARLGPMAERCRAAGLTRQADQPAGLRSDLAPAGAWSGPCPRRVSPSQLFRPETL